MRIRCPHCQGRFAVYPIPVTLASRQRRAGLVAASVVVLLAAGLGAALGPDLLQSGMAAMVRLLPERVGVGVEMALLVAPLVFLALGVYDRLTPHFGAPVVEDEQGEP